MIEVLADPMGGFALPLCIVSLMKFGNTKNLHIIFWFNGLKKLFSFRIPLIYIYIP